MLTNRGRKRETRDLSLSDKESLNKWPKTFQHIPVPLSKLLEISQQVTRNLSTMTKNLSSETRGLSIETKDLCASD